MVDKTPHQKPRAKTGAERTRTWRRKLALLAASSDVPAKVRGKDLSATPVVALPVTKSVTSVTPAAASPVTKSVTSVTPAAASPVTTSVTPVTPVAALPVTPNVTPSVTSHRHATNGRLNSSHGLTAAALALCGVALTTNGWFAWSLGSTDLAGWLFLAVGVAADLVLLAVPSTAAQLWQARKGATAVAAWLIWLIASVFALTGGIGFASSNIADVTLIRASRVTPDMTTAITELHDAMTSRDRECSGGRGRRCEEREHAVDERQKVRDAARSRVELSADPQTEAAIKIVAWLSAGNLKPTSDDFAMMRLVLLALLPQLGGFLLMISERARRNS
jgi:hypothetical protein